MRTSQGNLYDLCTTRNVSLRFCNVFDENSKLEKIFKIYVLFEGGKKYFQVKFKQYFLTSCEDNFGKISREIIK